LRSLPKFLFGSHPVLPAFTNNQSHTSIALLSLNLPQFVSLLPPPALSLSVCPIFLSSSFLSSTSQFVSTSHSAHFPLSLCFSLPLSLSLPLSPVPPPPVSLFVCLSLQTSHGCSGIAMATIVAVRMRKEALVSELLLSLREV